MKFPRILAKLGTAHTSFINGRILHLIGNNYVRKI